MREKTLVTISIITLLLIGIFFSCIYIFDTEFTFHSSKIELKNNTISEELIFSPDKEYHTLYRNFIDTISEKGGDGRIEIYSVFCQSGEDYFRLDSGKVYDGDQSIKAFIPYTEKNEYGCSFGVETGFKTKNDYSIGAEYLLKPEYTFLIQGEKYIKFVAYSKYRHPNLVRGDNFILSEGIISKQKYSPSEDVIIYIPTQETSQPGIIQSGFVYAKSRINPITISILIFFPIILFSLIWFYFGKENKTKEIPKELSFYPKERKAWQVAAYFCPPFLGMNKRFLSALMMDLERRKIIDIKTKERKILGSELFIKINKISSHEKIDEIEKRFLETIQFLYSGAKENERDGEYLNFSKIQKNYLFVSVLEEMYKDIKKRINKIGSKYIDTRGNGYIIGLGTLMFFIFFYIFQSEQVLKNGLMIAHMGLILLIYIIVSMKTTLFTKYKDKYYQEYLEWQGFKKYMEGNEMIKRYPKKSVIIWGHILVYSSALGIAKKVLKELRDAKIISDTQYETYSGIYIAASSYTSNSSSSNGGGVGGGGIGGGGGGGR